VLPLIYDTRGGGVVSKFEPGQFEESVNAKVEKVRTSSDAKKWRRKDRMPKVKTHVSIDPHIYLIGRNIGNVSALLNAAASHFIQHKDFGQFIQDWKVSAHARKDRDKNIPDPKDFPV
jgi:hypothetical protein